MRRAVIPLLVLGTAQWLALAWWQFVDGISVDVSLGVMFHELFGATPRVAWEPAQRLLTDFLEVTPGSLCLMVGSYLLVRVWLGRWAAEATQRRHVEGQRRAIRQDVGQRRLLVSEQDDSPAPGRWFARGRRICRS